MYEQYKFIFGCDCFISLKIMHSYLFLWEDIYLKVLKDQIQNAQNRRSGKTANHTFETYKKYVMPRVHHSYQKASDMAMSTMCAYPQS